MINVKSELERNGFSLFSISKDESTFDVGHLMGKVIEIENDLTIQRLIPREKENERNNSYSGNYGLSAFPLHSDMAHWYKPPKYLLIRCVNPAIDTYTSILDFEKILNTLSFNYDLAHFVPRKKINHKTNILKIKDDRGVCRWDSLFIKPFNNRGEVLTEILKHKLNSQENIKIRLINNGDCLIINNWRMLHGRSEIDRNSLHRFYERIYLSEIYND